MFNCSHWGEGEGESTTLRGRGKIHAVSVNYIKQWLILASLGGNVQCVFTHLTAAYLHTKNCIIYIAKNVHKSNEAHGRSCFT